MPEVNPKLFREICDTLFALGIPAHVSGYDYLINALTRVINDPTYLRAVTSRLYPDVAEDTGSTPQRVERSIRNAIEIGFSRCDVDLLTGYFGSAIDNSKGKTTNSEFIATAAQRIKLKLGIIPELTKL